MSCMCAGCVCIANVWAKQTERGVMCILNVQCSLNGPHLVSAFYYFATIDAYKCIPLICWFICYFRPASIYKIHANAHKAHVHHNKGVRLRLLNVEKYKRHISKHFCSPSGQCYFFSTERSSHYDGLPYGVRNIWWLFIDINDAILLFIFVAADMVLFSVDSSLYAVRLCVHWVHI